MFNKICAFCNEPFETKSGTQIYCKRQHYAVCVICGAKYPIKNCVEYKRTCSKACGAVLRKRTCQEVYGGNAPACSADVRKKMEDTNFVRFGTKSAMQSQIIKDKVAKTNVQRYGAASPLQSPIIQDQIKSTNIERYGVENPMLPLLSDNSQSEAQ